jgi:hypothetical protein
MHVSYHSCMSVFGLEGYRNIYNHIHTYSQSCMHVYVYAVRLCQRKGGNISISIPLALSLSNVYICMLACRSCVCVSIYVDICTYIWFKIVQYNDVSWRKKKIICGLHIAENAFALWLPTWERRGLNNNGFWMQGGRTLFASVLLIAYRTNVYQSQDTACTRYWSPVSTEVSLLIFLDWYCLVCCHWWVIVKM